MAIDIKRGPAARREPDLFEREEALRIQAGQVMKELRARGEDWQSAWRDHPVAKAYRQLLKDAWERPTPKVR